MQLHPLVNELYQVETLPVPFECLLANNAHFTFLYLSHHLVSNGRVKKGECDEMNG